MCMSAAIWAEVDRVVFGASTLEDADQYWPQPSDVSPYELAQRAKARAEALSSSTFSSTGDAHGTPKNNGSGCSRNNHVNSHSQWIVEVIGNVSRAECQTLFRECDQIRRCGSNPDEGSPSVATTTSTLALPPNRKKET